MTFINQYNQVISEYFIENRNIFRKKKKKKILINYLENLIHNNGRQCY